MKRAVMLLLLIGCGGKGEIYPVNFTATREFTMQSDPMLMQDAQAVLKCVQRVEPRSAIMGVQSGIVNLPELTIETTSAKDFMCGNQVALGCASFPDRRIYITEAQLYTEVFSHELVHQLTLDSDENGAAMLACQDIAKFN
jgi:hypothetical protein